MTTIFELACHTLCPLLTMCATGITNITTIPLRILVNNPICVDDNPNRRSIVVVDVIIVLPKNESDIATTVIVINNHLDV